MDTVHTAIAEAQRELFRLIVEADHWSGWDQHGARDLAHWLCMRYGISEWKARRWLVAAHALDGLPKIDAAFSCGALGIDKVVELTRFATSETEEQLVPWALKVSGSWIRKKADLYERRSLDDVRMADRSRSLVWWYEDDGRRVRI